jgi:hypothetical protein
VFSTGQVGLILSGNDGLPFRMVDGPLWIEDTATALEGSSMRSGVIGDGASTSFELPSVPGGQTVTWSVRVSSEPTGDTLRFYVNGVEVPGLRRSGEVGWTELSHDLPPLGPTPTNILTSTDTLSSPAASVANDPIQNLIDGNPATIYRSLDRANVTVSVAPRSGRTLVTGLHLTTRDYAPERAPADWEIQGSEDGVNFVPIASGVVPEITSSGSPTTGIPAPTSGTILREVFFGVPGVQVFDLLRSPTFLRGSSFASPWGPAVEMPPNLGDNYGQRLRGYIIPPITGTYRFWIASDDASSLLLSSDESVQNARLIASVEVWTNPREWTRSPSQQSADIRLVGKRAYYLEVLHKEGSGKDHLAVGWQLPDGTLERPIPTGTRFIPVGGALPIATSTTTTHRFSFANTRSFTAYRVRFPSVRTPADANSMQVAELALMGVPAGHSLKWAYEKDATKKAGSDAAWVDRIRLAYWPGILSQPQGSTNVVGSTLRLVTRIRGGTGSKISWLKDGAPLANGDRIAGADSTELVIRGAVGADTGSYICRVTNAYGEATSEPATVVVPVAPSITVQPVGTNLNVGSDLELSVVASGSTPLTYVWRRNGQVIPGATGSLYKVSSVRAETAGNYSVVVANTFGAVQSTVVPVGINDRPTITTQPVPSIAGVTGQRITLSVVATSPLQPLDMQWRKNGQNLADGDRVQGANSSFLTLSGLESSDAGEYSVVVVNPFGSVVSTASVLTVTPRNLVPTLDEIPDSTINEDAAATSVALTGITDGNGGTQTLAVTASSSNPQLLANPVVTGSPSSGSVALSFSPVPGKSGTALVTVRVQDGGGTVDGAVDFVERQFTVTVLSLNDAPTLDVPGAVSVLDEGVESGNPFVDSLSGLPAGSILRGEASWVPDNGGSIQLTPSGQTMKRGAFFLSDFNTNRVVQGFVAGFRLRADQGSAVRGDGISFNFMPEDPAVVDLGNGTEGPNPAEGLGTGLSIGFLTGQNNKAVLRVGGQQVAEKTGVTINGSGTDAAMSQVEVVVSPDGRVTVRLDGVLVFDAVQTSIRPAENWRFGWAARTSDSHSRQSIDDLGIHPFLRRLRPRSNVLSRSDTVVSLTGSSPAAESVANAIDGTPDKKFLVFGTGGMGLSVAPGVGATVVNAIAITSANDAPQRDPGAYELWGSNDGTTFERIASAQINPDPRRFLRRVFEFPNGSAFTSYRILFPRPQVVYDHLQVAEVEILGRRVVTVPLSGISDGDDGKQMISVTATSSDPAVIRAPSVDYQTPRATGRLVFDDLPPGANGTATIAVRVQDDAGTANGGVDTVARSFEFRVTPINQPPTLAEIPTVSVDTSSALTVEVPLSAITAGGDVLPGAVTVTAVSSPDASKPLALSPILAHSSPQTTGKLSFSIPAGASGVATVTVTVKDTAGTANGGVDTFTRSFAVKAGPQPPVIEAAPANQVARPGDTVAFSVRASGIGLNYQWSKDGTPILGATGATLELPLVSASSVGTYSVRVFNSNLENQNPTVQAFLALWNPPSPTDVQPSQQAQFSVPVTLPSGFTVSRQWIFDGSELGGSNQETLTIGTTTRGSVGGYAARVTVASPTLGSVTLTSPPVPLRLISDLTTLRSTGINTNGQRLTDRATDPHYTLIDPSPIKGPAVAVVTSGTFPIPPWTAGGTASAWISPSARLREPGSAVGIDYVYRTTFSLQGIDLNTVRIRGRVAADDTVTEIRLNGRSLDTPRGIGFVGYTDFDLTPGSSRAGDRFIERGSLGSGSHVAVVADTSGATVDDGEPFPLGTGVHGPVASVWWNWRAPSNCRVTVTTAGSGIPSILSVFEGVVLDRLRHIGSADGAGAAAETVRSVTFTAVAGRDYPIRIDGYLAAEGAVRLVLRAENLGTDGQVTGTVPALTELAPGLSAGENTLDFVVRNTADAGLDRGLTGLRVEFTSVQGVPRPVILTASPSGGFGTYGDRKTFIAQVISGTPVTYEWYRDGQLIEGADEPTLTFNRLEEGDSGSYSVRVQNMNGSVWTTPVPFEVDVPLAITTQPSGMGARVGGTARLAVRFRGNPPLSVQWYRNGDPVPGATSTTLVIPNLTIAQAGRYHAVVSDRDDFRASAEAVVDVLEPPQIVQEPLDVAVISGVGSLKIQTIVDGSSPVRHLWFRNDVPLDVADSPILDLGIARPSQAGRYHLMATNPVGVVVSRAVTVTVHEPPAIVSGSGDVKAFEGEKATFSVTASGSGDLDYNWYLAGTLIPGARGNSIDLAGLSRGQGGRVAVVVRSAYGTVTNNYNLEVLTPPVPVVSTGVNRIQQFNLKPGWNAIYLEVQPEPNDVATVFKGIPFTSLWRWSDPGTGPQFIADQSEAKLDVARWQIHLPADRPGSFQNNLAAVFRNEAYLVNISADAPVTLTVTGKPGYQRSRWAVDGYTLTGLPVDPDWSGGVSVASFFGPSSAHYDAAASRPRGIHKLQSNGVWIPLSSTDVLAAGEAYWIYTQGSSDYLAPIETEIPGVTEISYPLGGDQKELAFNFRSAAAGDGVRTVYLSHWLPDQSLPLRISEFAPQEGTTWLDLPNGYPVSPTQGTRRTIRLAAGRDRVPGLLYEGILTLKAAGVRHVIPLTIERDKPDTVAQASRPFNPVGLWMGTVRVSHVSEVNGLTTNYTVVQTTNVVDGVTNMVSGAVTEVRNVQQGGRPTPVKEPFEMRLMLHTGIDGVSQLLQSVTLLKKADSVTVANQVVTQQKGGEGVLISDPSLLGSFEGVALKGRDKVGNRFSTPFYPMYRTNGIPFDAGLDLGRRIQASWSLPPGAPLNPYRHKYHPDHDNLDRSFQTYKAEAYPVRRTVVLDIPVRQGSTRKPGAGQDEIEGVYTEVIEGIHRIPITVQGTVTLQRLVPIGTINPPKP